MSGNQKLNPDVLPAELDENVQFSDQTKRMREAERVDGVPPPATQSRPNRSLIVEAVRDIKKNPTINVSLPKQGIDPYVIPQEISVRRKEKTPEAPTAEEPRTSGIVNQLSTIAEDPHSVPPRKSHRGPEVDDEEEYHSLIEEEQDHSALPPQDLYNNDGQDDPENQDSDPGDEYDESMFDRERYSLTNRQVNRLFADAGIEVSTSLAKRISFIANGSGRDYTGRDWAMIVEGYLLRQVTEPSYDLANLQTAMSHQINELKSAITAQETFSKTFDRNLLIMSQWTNTHMTTPAAQTIPKVKFTPSSTTANSVGLPSTLAGFKKPSASGSGTSPLANIVAPATPRLTRSKLDMLQEKVPRMGGLSKAYARRNVAAALDFYADDIMNVTEEEAEKVIHELTRRYWTAKFEPPQQK